MLKFNFNLFKEICETRAVSGDEKALVSLLKEYYLKYSDEIVYDNQGSMVAHKKCYKEGAKKVLVLVVFQGMFHQGLYCFGLEPFVSKRVYE